MKDGTIVLILNALIYFLTSLYCWKKKYSNISVFLWIFYALLSIGAIFLYNLNGAWKFKEITIFPMVYLFVILFICIYPLTKVSVDKVEKNIYPDSTFMNVVSLSAIFSYTFFFLFTILPSFGISNLFNPEILMENYELKNESIGSKSSGINFWGVMKNLFEPILWILLVYNAIVGNKKITMGIFFCLLVSILTSLAWGARGPLIFTIMGLPFIYLLFKNRMPEKMKKIFIILVIAILFFIVLGFAMLTIGRFGDHDKYYSLSDIVLYYASSSFINFDNYVLYIDDYRYGDRVLPLIRFILGFDISDNFLERRLKFANLPIDDSKFMTFVGEFVLDFGPYFAFCILIFFSNIFLIVSKKKYYDLGDVLLMSLCYNIIANGFTLFPYSEISGNMTILKLIIWCCLFKYFTKNKIYI